jgi:hypothetical protein
VTGGSRSSANFSRPEKRRFSGPLANRTQGLPLRGASPRRNSELTSLSSPGGDAIRQRPSSGKKDLKKGENEDHEKFI